MRLASTASIPTACWATLAVGCLGLCLVVAAQSCNCPGLGGYCPMNCTKPSECCGSGSMEPSCLTNNNQCCIWWLGAVQCAATDSCCGELGYGASSSAFCCGAGSSCCATWGDGTSQCCGPKQQCCKGYDSYCCDADTEVCGPDDANVCLPKFPITRNPHAKPGQLEWAANLSSSWSVHTPLMVNDSFVAASGGNGTALVRLADGMPTFILPTSLVAPVLVAGRVIVATFDGLVTYDLKDNNQSWAASFSFSYTELVSYEHYLLALSDTALNVYDARNGTLLYAIPYTYQPMAPVVSPLGTAAFIFQDTFIIFRVDTGKVLVNAGTTCSTQPPPLLAGSMFVSCNLVAYSARSGKQLWAAASSPPIQSVAATTKAIVAATQAHIYFFAKSNGSLIQKLAVPFQSEYTVVLTGVGSEVLVVLGNVTAYNGTTGAQLWERVSAEYSFYYFGSTHGDYVYLPASSNVFPASLVAMHTATGHIAGSWGAGGAVSTPVFVSGRMLFMSADGLLYCVNAL